MSQIRHTDIPPIGNLHNRHNGEHRIHSDTSIALNLPSSYMTKYHNSIRNNPHFSTYEQIFFHTITQRLSLYSSHRWQFFWSPTLVFSAYRILLKLNHTTLRPRVTKPHARYRHHPNDPQFRKLLHYTEVHYYNLSIYQKNYKSYPSGSLEVASTILRVIH